MSQSNEKRVSMIVVPNGDFRHVRSKQGKDWYVQRAGLLAEDGLTEAFEVWHKDQKECLKPGTYRVEDDGAYVTDGRLQVRSRFVGPIPMPTKS